MDTDVDSEGPRAVAGAEAADKAPMEGISTSATATGDDMVANQVPKAAADKIAPDEERPSAQAAADAHRHDDEEPPDNIDVFPPQSQESAAMSTLTPSQDYLDEYESEGLTEAELRGLGVVKDNAGASSGAAAAASAAAAAAAVGGDASVGDLPCTQDTIPTVNLDHRDAGDDDNDDGHDDKEAPVESSQQSSLLLDTQPPDGGGSTATGSSIGVTSGSASGIAAKRSAAGDAICSEDCREDYGGGACSKNTKNKRQKTSSEQGNGEGSPTGSIVAEIASVSESAPASAPAPAPAPAPASNRMSLGRTKRLGGSRRRSKYADRPRRRRRWTDGEGVPSFLAILTSDTPPPSDDEEEMEDTARREKEWAEHGRFVVDIDALIGLAPPESGGGVVVKEEESGDGGGDGSASATEIDLNDGEGEEDDPLAEYLPLPPSGGGTKEKIKTNAKSSLYRIGSDVRARVWNAAIEGGSVLPDESSSSDVIWLGDYRAADPFVAPGVVRPDLSGLTRRSDGDGAAFITANGLPVDIKSSELIRSTGVSLAMSTTTPKTFFEGIMPLALPDDKDYLPELHCLVRQNLELFSATDADCADKSYGKRTPIVRGKVGIRCVHCAAASIAAVSTDATAPDFVGSNSQAPLSSPQRKLKYIGGSVSYISSLSSLSNIACQKPQLHFASCPHTPSNVKEHLHRLTHDEDGNPLRQRAGTVVRKLGISSTKYWLVAARRVGLVDVRSGGGGIRFGRDPQLPPRAAEEVISEDPSLTGPVYSAAPAAVTLAGASPAGLESVAASSAAAFPMAMGIMTKTTKIKADENSDAVLQGILGDIKAYEEEKHNSDDGQTKKSGHLPFLVTSHDLDVSSDYSFLLASLVTVVHATHYDAMNPRGKRAKSFRPGTTGFTCRNCAEMVRQREEKGGIGGYEVGIAASSFPSTEMALCTTVTQSLLNHWQKCANTTQEVKDAILAYKKIHPMQVSQLPKGTNGRFWAMLWNRLRALDKESSEMVDDSGRDDRILPADSLTNAAATRIPTEAPSQVNPRSPSPSPNERPKNFPISSNQETLEVLDAAKNEAFDGVLFASLSEMMLVTDFVILIMRQLSPCQLLTSDLKYRRNVGKGGVQCKHCLKRGTVRYGGAASGRTFPSAPDNWASSLKESCFTHLMRCDMVPENVQRALADLKALHTEQMNTLKFGAQRQYLRILHQRITAWAAANREGATANASVNKVEVESNIRLPQVEADDTSLEKHGFCLNPMGWYGCIRCRMVPFDLRAKRSLSQQRPHETFVAQHANICKGETFDLSALLTVAKDMVDAISNPKISLEIIQSPAFKEFVRSLVGDSDNLVDVLTEGVVALSKAAADASTDTSTGDEKFNSRGLWASFPASINLGTTKLLFDNLLREIDFDSAEKLRTNEHFKAYIRIVAPSIVDFNWMNGENQDETASPKQAT